MVEMETAPLERNGEGHMVGPTPTAFQNSQVGGDGGGGDFQIHWKRIRFFGISPEQHGMAAFSSKPCGLEAICEILEEPCLGLPTTTAPRVRVGSRSLRRVDKTDGERVEGLSYKDVGELVAGLSRRKCQERAEGFSDAFRNCSCRKTYSWHLVWVETSRVVNCYDGRDGDERPDGFDGSDG